MTTPLELGRPRPSGWRTFRLKDVTTYVNRGTAPEYADSETGFLAFNQKCVRPDLSVTAELGRPVVEGSFDLRAPARLRAGDVVVNSTGRGTLGRAAILRSEPECPTVADGHVTIIRTKPDLADERFVAYILGTRAFYGQANACLAVGSTNQTELSREALRRVVLTLPPPALQRRIVEHLDVETGKVDELVAEHERLIDLLLDRRAAELDGWIEHGGVTAELTDVASPWVDAVPQGWSFMPLKRCVERVMVGIVINPSAFYEDEGVPVLRGLNVRPGRVSSNDLVFMSPESNELHGKSMLKTGDVVVVRTGVAGAAAEVPGWAVGGNVVDLLVVRPGARLLPGFLEHLLNSRLVQQQVRYGSVGALQSHFNTSALANVMAVVPPVAEQQRVLGHLTPALRRYDELIAEAQRQIRLLREHRQALITAAVTGGLDALQEVARCRST